MLAFTAKQLVTPTEIVDRPLLLVSEGRVSSIARADASPSPASDASALDFGDDIIAPGYFDLHIHGGRGFDVMDDTPGALPAIERLLVQHGVTSYYPTTLTAPVDTTLRSLERLADAIERRPSGAEAPDRARPAGIH